MERVVVTASSAADLPTYQYMDLIHDAVCNGLASQGIPQDELVGQQARHWGFGVRDWVKGRHRYCRSLHLFSPDEEIAPALRSLDPAAIRKVRNATNEAFLFERATVESEPAPVVAGQTTLQALFITPLVVQRLDRSPNSSARKCWYTDIRDIPDEAIARSLTKFKGTAVDLRLHPDELYLMGRERHSARVPIKKYPNQSKPVFVLGVRAPITLKGSSEDLKLAWYGGLGEKHRLGFGCIGEAGTEV